MNNGLFIIGNGFDLDLGLKTKYRDFIESEPFESILQTNDIAQYIYHNYKEKNWIDVEKNILNYALYFCNTDEPQQVQEDNFKQLTDALNTYLTHIEKDLNPDSCAAKVLRAIVENGNYNIVSYNYTDLFSICAKLNINIGNISIENVHGSLKNHSIILGFQDDVKVRRSAYFMIKSHNPSYRSFNIRKQLALADDIVFYGHSLGETDYHYFRDFFECQSGLKDTNVKEKSIRFFTYDEESRQDLLAQLREMNESRVNYLFDLNDLEFFKTSEEADSERIEAFLNNLRKTSLNKIYSALNW